MGINLDRATTIGGLRASVVKQALRHLERHGSPLQLVDLRSLFATRKDGIVTYELCVLRGLVDPDTHRPTKAGKTFARARLTKRAPLVQAQELIEALLVKISAFNADESNIDQVDQIWLFGSVMRGEPTVGDIDLAIKMSFRPEDNDDSKARSHRVVQAVAMEGGCPQNRRYWWEKREWLTERRIFGRKRHPLLSGVQLDLHDLIGIGAPCQLIFDTSQGGRVFTQTITSHPDSETTAQAILELEPEPPEASPPDFRPLDGRWLSGVTTDGEVSFYQMYRGWEGVPWPLHDTSSRKMTVRTDLADQIPLRCSSSSSILDGRHAIEIGWVSRRNPRNCTLRRSIHWSNDKLHYQAWFEIDAGYDNVPLGRSLYNDRRRICTAAILIAADIELASRHFEIDISCIRIVIGKPSDNDHPNRSFVNEALAHVFIVGNVVIASPYIDPAAIPNVEVARHDHHETPHTHAMGCHEPHSSVETKHRTGIEHAHAE